MSEDDAMYKMPPTDTTPFSLMLWFQFGFFLLMLYESTFNSTDVDDGPPQYFGLVFVIVGLLLLMRVKNGVLGAMGVLVAAPVVFGLVDGEGMNFILEFMFSGGPDGTCSDTLDANDDGTRDISDPIQLLILLIGAGTELPPPWTNCGIDPTADALDCVAYAPCP